APTALAFQGRPVDFDNDGRIELVTTSYFGSPSLLQWYSKKMTESPASGWEFRGFLNMAAHPETPLAGPGISTIDPVDWDNDGDTDLLLGGEPGTPMIAINIGTENKKVFSAPTRLRFTDGSFLETYSSQLGDGSHHGPKEWFDDRSTPRAVDWDQDGILDIISGTQGRRIYWMKGTFVHGELRFNNPKIFMLDGKPLLHPHRCFPDVVDWNKDGKLDIAGFNERSDLVFYLGKGDSELVSVIPLSDTHGKPISASPKIKDPSINASPSGRSGVAVADWDQDGILDLITFKHYFDGRVLFYKGIGDRTFEEPVKLFDFFSHLAGPGILDWNLDGHPDILMGGDYRRLAGLSYQMPTEDRAHYYVYFGNSLPVPSAKK
ncbi:MAG: VCBS repeat-containing protein, partial [Verrucomicrobiae bacterium]|nr:VCBS repeat-containing protein [Verrucomicrobiae bacterium]